MSNPSSFAEAAQTNQSYPDLAQSDLLPGDFGLTLGRSQISKLIAWAGDSLYSHAFIVFDQNQLIEAAPGGVRLVQIAQRMREPSLLLFDVYRPSNASGESFSAQEIAAIQAKAREYIGRGYPLNELLQLGLMCALRNKTPNSDAMRWILRIAMDALIHDDPKQMVCSELIFRVLREANVQPRAALEPAIINPVRSHAAMPPIDLAALIREIEAMFPKAGVRAQVELSHFDLSQNPAAYAAFSNKTAPSAAELAKMATTIRAKYAQPEINAGVFIVPNPNPKTVLPADLERSPSARFLARMRLSRDCKDA